ncbi:folate receptor family-domain-containing protein [Baffinella frigidus]|nr:folate receptor family-domain-containing protein [Cryptophyta sp. CCMP2293]
MFTVHRAMLAVGLAATLAAADPDPGCKKFSEIYKGGKELCENMWDGAFEYSTDEDKAYTMWWEFGENPNKAAAVALGVEPSPATCKLHGDYYHKKTPGPELDSNHECWPWKNEACCEDKTVASRDVIQDAYGAEFHWDRCGPLSQACERFFVKEACLYECEPLTGHYRKYPDGPDYNGSSTGGEDNTWQITKMPIKASFCDNWHHACK